MHIWCAIRVPCKSIILIVCIFFHAAHTLYQCDRCPPSNWFVSIFFFSLEHLVECIKTKEAKKYRWPFISLCVKWLPFPVHPQFVNAWPHQTNCERYSITTTICIYRLREFTVYDGLRIGKMPNATEIKRTLIVCNFSNWSQRINDGGPGTYSRILREHGTSNIFSWCCHYITIMWKM